MKLVIITLLITFCVCVWGEGSVSLSAIVWLLLPPCPPSTAQMQHYVLVLSCVSTALCSLQFICLRLCKPAKGALSSPTVTSLLWPVKDRQAKFVRFLVSLTLSEQRWHFQQLSESPGRMVIDIAHAKDLPFSGNSGNSSVLLTLWTWQSGWVGDCVNVLLSWVTRSRLLAERSLITEHQSYANHSETWKWLSNLSYHRTQCYWAAGAAALASRAVEHSKNWSLASETTVWDNSYLCQVTEDSSKRKELQQHSLYVSSTLEISELL